MAPPHVVTHSITFPPPQRITDVINRDDCYDDDQRVFDYTDCSGVPGCWVVTPILRGRRRPSAFPLPRKTFDLTLSAQKPVTAKFLRAAGQVATASLGVVNSWKAKQQVSPIDDVLFLDSVEALAEKIRKGEVTNSFISRLKKVDEVLNCVTRADFKGALKDARRADKLVKTYPVDTLKRAFPLLGVPFCVPENMAVAGFPCTAGILVRKNEVAESTLFLVDNVRRAGAIFLAQTNVSEYGLSVDTENPVYGKTHNPYDTRRVAGGDWGGAAALVSSGGCPFAIGLEMTGSCRISAAFCGLFAHTVPVPDELVEGMYQPAILCHGLAVAGVLTKFPSDLPLVLTVMRAPAMRRLWGPRSYFDNVKLKKVKLLYMLDMGGRTLVDCPVDPRIKDMVEETSRWMSCLMKLKAKEVKIPYLDLSFELFVSAISKLTDQSFLTEEMTGGLWRKNAVNELFKSAVGCSDHTASLVISAILQDSFVSEENEIWRTRLEHVKGLLRKKLKRVLKRSVLLYPTYPLIAPFHGQPLWCYTSFAYSAIFNVLKFPSTHVTLGYTSDSSLPVGVQLVTSQKRAHEALAIAIELQRVFPRASWKPVEGSVPFPRKPKDRIRCGYFRTMA